VGSPILSLFPPADFALIAIILALPLIGALVCGLFGKRLGDPAVRLMALAAVGGSFLAAAATFAALHSYVDAMGHKHVTLAWTAWRWMHTNGGADMRTIPIDVRFSVDALSGVMMLIITGVGFLIHLYATSYMANDPGFARFFAYLNLFIFAMLVLVLADNLPVLFVGWEGVGLCSYLLIGFWYDKAPNAAAGKKAFIANRIGDFGLICAMFLLASYTGSLDWSGMQSGAQSLLSGNEQMLIHLWPFGGVEYHGWLSFLQPHTPFTISAATAAGLMIVLGCTGKSAQIPLYVWLPDAMAGPTPVSALIHAATMVTAGIYLICRLSFLMVLSPFVMMTIAIIGACTALLAASIALVQNDIKKVLAYSTVSQLGFMFLGVGVGAFTAGFFHVFTPAFFKACLFLCAGSVIHAMHARVHDDERAQDMRNMGGLRKYMPLTYWTFVAATAAIIGVPLTSGFFSKDEILYRAFVDHTVSPFADLLTKQKLPPFEPPLWLGQVLYGVAFLAAVMTAFYMCRALFLTFWGDFRGWTIGRPSLLAKAELDGGHDDDSHEHHEDLSTPGYPPHESPWQMTVPLIILATCSIFVGLFFNAGPIKVPALHSMDSWLEPVFADVGTAVQVNGGEAKELGLAASGILAFAIGSALAYWMYIVEKGEPGKRAALAYPSLYRLVYEKWRVDELYEATVVLAVDALADTFEWFDRTFVDLIIARIPALVVSGLGSFLRIFQNGVVHFYAAMMALGLVALGWFFAAPHARLLVDASAAESKGDYVITAAPGMGYQYRWDTDGDGQFDKPQSTDQSNVKIHLNEHQSQSVRVEVTNAFGFHSTASVPLTRPAPAPTMVSVSPQPPGAPVAMPGAMPGGLPGHAGPAGGTPPGLPPGPPGHGGAMPRLPPAHPPVQPGTQPVTQPGQH
jgi:NADH-quinone oxidoreductase subunit L